MFVPFLKRVSPVLASLILAAGPAPAPPLADDPGARRALQSLQARLGSLGLDAACGLEVCGLERDPSGEVHVRIQQRHRGLRVWGGQAIVHLGTDGREAPLTDALVRGIRLQPTPNLDSGEALAAAQDRLAPRGTYARPPEAELLVYPETALEEAFAGAGNAEDFEVRVAGHRLAWHVHMELQNGAEETRHEDFLVDAHTGSILKAWSSLLTLAAGTPVTTLGRSLYSGEVKLGSLSMPCGFILSDPTRSHLSTRDMGERCAGEPTLYVSPVPQWGDGRNYERGQGTRSENGQTAAVDAHYGLQTAWDFYQRILGRNGIDGKGRSVSNRVHYGKGYDNAFWSNGCFCMTYGDGTTFRSLTSLDVVGHEVSHGLCASTAGLGYTGESGALNEANSDIFGAMIVFYARGAQGQGERIPEEGGRWSIGQEIQGSSHPHPLRDMRKPSLDGFSPDEWSPLLQYLDVHHASGPMNRAFYFLSQGASADPRDEAHSPRLPEGMKGIGNDKALRIWWRTLSTRLTPTSRYLDARKGAIQAAQELFGHAAPEVTAVRKAFQAIHVGRCTAPARPPGPPGLRRTRGAAMDTSD